MIRTLFLDEGKWETNIVSPLFSLFELLTDLQLSIFFFSILTPVQRLFLSCPLQGFIIAFPFHPNEDGSRLSPFIWVSNERITIGTDLKLWLNPRENKRFGMGSFVSWKYVVETEVIKGLNLAVLQKSNIFTDAIAALGNKKTQWKTYKQCWPTAAEIHNFSLKD